MPHILNAKTLLTSPLRSDALQIAEAGFEALTVGSVLRATLRVEDDSLVVGEKIYPLLGRRVYVVGVGKCAFAAARAFEEILGERITAGIALDTSPLPQEMPEHIRLLRGTHPLPSETNEKATREILGLLSGLRENDLVLFLISGGGSTLLCSPEAPTTCTDEAELFRALTAKGASIQELNTVRKHTSRARGGALAVAAYPAEVLSLIASDVPGNELTYVASGPTILDLSTQADAESVLEKYSVPIDSRVALMETEKDPRFFERVTNLLVLSSDNALQAMHSEAARLGYQPSVISTHFSGEARDIGRSVVEKLHGAEARTALLFAGESTVTVGSSGGKGGRNQELALASLEGVLEGEIVIPFASDGHDNTDHAGAIADTLARQHALDKGLSIAEYLDQHRSYDFFEATGDALITGHTGSNVSDIIIALKN